MTKLAIEGGKPVRKNFLPYGRHFISPEDVKKVEAVLLSGMITQGKQVVKFEQAFAKKVGAKYAVALSSGTAALHATVALLDLAPGDEVIVPPITFAATANAVVYCGGKPVFADIDPQTGLIDPAKIEKAVTKKTKAVISVHYAGHLCDTRAIDKICKKKKLAHIVDAAHALGALDNGRKVGSKEWLCIFSTHPVKHITSGEGGLVTANNKRLAQRIAAFRSHGIYRRPAQAKKIGGWFYEMNELGYNYRLSDINCALGLSQLKYLDRFNNGRRRLAQRYYRLLADKPYLQVVPEPSYGKSAHHIFPVLLNLDYFSASKKKIFDALQAENIGVQVHYIPVYHHPYYQKTFGTKPGLCPMAEQFYQREITLPLFPAMTNRDIDEVILALDKVYERYQRKGK